jgi:hypothetical protein
MAIAWVAVLSFPQDPSFLFMVKFQKRMSNIMNPQTPNHHHIHELSLLNHRT